MRVGASAIACPGAVPCWQATIMLCPINQVRVQMVTACFLIRFSSCAWSGVISKSGTRQVPATDKKTGVIFVKRTRCDKKGKCAVFKSGVCVRALSNITIRNITISALHRVLHQVRRRHLAIGVCRKHRFGQGLERSGNELRTTTQKCTGREQYQRELPERSVHRQIYELLRPRKRQVQFR